MTPDQISKAYGINKTKAAAKKRTVKSSSPSSRVRPATSSPRKGGCCGKKAR
ncbi:hypothetical protein [Rossellomorea vietnamensis]|uniref:hypothetical protein n=1 Tax=Rossellomorea vietnamensis TaxID=218284 RepID=UPI0016539AB7|nr:hypothetical protein [Rossellomorea vietnamensis]